MNSENPSNSPESPFSKKNSYRAWLLLCFSTGPVSSMTKTYVPAVIQSSAFALGHTAAGQKCQARGNDCFVNFGTGKVHYTSYVLYIRAIGTALEGLISILLMGIADYGNYKRWILIFSIIFYGILALPFAGLTSVNYPTLKILSALYILLSIDDAIYQILEGSYIPLFMRAAAETSSISTHLDNLRSSEEIRRDVMLKRGSTVSVMGLFVGNIGGLIALLIGIIITYSSGAAGYHNFLLAITVAAVITVVLAIVASFYIPKVKLVKQRPRGEWLIILTIKRFYNLWKDIQKYPNAFLYCISWVIWNVSYSNFLGVYGLLFRSTLGLGVSDPQFTVLSFMSVIVACMGSLSWMYLYPRLGLNIKTWGYIFFSVQIFSNFWGSLGISHNVRAVGFKNLWEFWLFEVLFNSSGSALRSLNRTVYSTLLPRGEEAQYFGLEIMLGVATGWIGSLVIAVIQDRTGNDRYPFLPNLFLSIIALALYVIVDFEKGMTDVQKL